MSKVIIIAEAGVNHNGDIGTAMKLVEEAAKAGADYVKFQTFRTEKNISQSAKKAEYQIEATGAAESQFEMVKKLELSNEDHFKLIAHCKLNNIKFLSTAFDHESVDLLEEIGIDFFKIPSGEIVNLPLLEKIADTAKNVVISTGMAELLEIRSTIEVFTKRGYTKDQITILHCNTEYPTPMEDVNLKAMLTMADEFQTKFGYSDHTSGIEIPIAAVALGATLIEKHFTLDKSMKGPDHKASLEPDELSAMISAIRNIEVAMGTGIKKPSNSEQKNIAIARKSIHLTKALEEGQELTTADLIMLRPGDGISPMEYHSIIGKKVNKPLPLNHKLTWKDVH